MRLQPLKSKYKKPHKIKSFKGMKGRNFLAYTCGLKIKSNAYFDHPQLEAVRRMLSRQTKSKKDKRIKNVKHHKYIKMMKLKAEREAKSGNASKRRKKKKRKYYIIRSTLFNL